MRRNVFREETNIVKSILAFSQCQNEKECFQISSRALATIQNIGKTWKQGKLFELNMYFDKILYLF